MKSLDRVLVVAAALTAGGASLPAQLWEVGNFLLVSATPQAGATFGSSLAAGDFDGDGIDDLAVGAPLQDSSSSQDTGRVEIRFGRSNRTFSPAAVLEPLTQAQAEFGWPLVAGDFDGAPPDELAIGAIGFVETPGDIDDGAAFVADFSLPGPTITLHIFLQAGFAMEAETNDHFGFAFASGDVDGDGFGDLAIGVPGDNLAALDAGAVALAFGGPGGLTTVGSQVFDVRLPHPPSLAGARDFGYALASGDFDDDGFDDLAVGEPGHGQPVAEAGQVLVVRGSAAGVTSAGAQRLDDFSFGTALESGDRFGHTLSAGDFDAADPFECAFVVSCVDDLAIGVPLEDDGATLDAGKLIVAFGLDGVGLSTSGAQVVNQALLGAGVEFSDRFAGTLAAGALDARGPLAGPRFATDLAVGASTEDFFADADGAAHALLGFSGGLSTATAQLFTERVGFASFPPADADRFGAALAIGDFDGDGVGDLAVGVPGKNRPEGPFAGAVQVIYGALFADGFGSGAFFAWDFL